MATMRPSTIAKVTVAGRVECHAKALKNEFRIKSLIRGPVRDDASRIDTGVAQNLLRISGQRVAQTRYLEFCRRDAPAAVMTMPGCARRRVR